MPSIDDINADSIKAILKNAPLKTKQVGVSIPIVKRFYALLQEGSEAPPIKVCDGVIVDGNHRYIAGLLFGKAPEIVPATTSSIWKITPVVKWADINCDLHDWGND